ncbi:MAG TPA: sulfite oxidase heme-binding subunit YedZ [Campylobacter avium]|uniref:sulfite oxidase heme-binding subunit YedZ n=1 Tax=Campylobacter avium TaxID=522485 RepID=UPI001DB34168|nr:sulfite oxidase heme-binding subunit YedZ [Campylobacter avium]HJE66937.1 sulfite oxidase heme-binding subunit YedZ [Campylobacter avium]
MISSKRLVFLAYMLFVLSFVYSAFMLYKNYYFDILAELYFYTGIFALGFCFLSLFFALFKFKKCKKLPRLFGIFAFIWALLHFLAYFIFSKHLSFKKLFYSIFSYGIEFSGFLSFVLMFFMLLASFSFFKRLKFSLKFGYVLLFLVSLHYFLSPKLPQLSHYFFIFLAFLFIILRYARVLKRKS